MKSHGNSKAQTPYHLTWSSTKQRIKDECNIKGPKNTVSTISTDVGGIIHATAPGELPRNEKQIFNYKQRAISRAPADDLFAVMQQAYTDVPSNTFIRAVNAAPEPAVVVATNSQLNNLVRFCTSSFEFCILTIDPTFSGDFDVTLTTFRHLFLQSKRFNQASPVLVGPACVHFKKTFSTYLFFASTLIGQCRELEGICVFGTDGEQALVDAFKHELHFAQHLTCFIHVRRNIKDKLHECDIPSNVSVEILNDTLGVKIGTTYVEGLVDANNIYDFDVKLEKLLTKWRGFEDTSTGDMERFINWFKSYKAPIIRTSML